MSKSLYSLEERQLWVNRFYDSGSLNKVEFCKEHGLIYNTFKHWIIVYEKLKTQKNNPTLPIPLKSSIKEDSFVSLKIENEQSVSTVGQPVMEVKLSNGSTLCFYQNVSASFIRELLQ